MAAINKRDDLVIMQQTLFDMDIKTIDDISRPDTYKGITSFHKYWGKKPTESLEYFIQNYTAKDDIVLDPFLGSGLISVEALSRSRKFIGIDINPFAIEHTKFLLCLPNPDEYWVAFKTVEEKVKKRIFESYVLKDNKIASHFLWAKDVIKSIWTKPDTGRSRIEREPSEYDYTLFNYYNDYKVKNIRDLVFFTNSRINSKPNMTLYDVFTKRALRNIDLIINEIKIFPENIQRALLLTLTSSSGQMSNMVFAISGRGKTTNKPSLKIEVGSWVIGFWRPELHFEINVWNCFESRANKLRKALYKTDTKKYSITNNITDVFNNGNKAAIVNDNCLQSMKKIPDKSIKLICTDPPHSDRIPYLELSEIWNAILNKTVSFDAEIIFSNAKERNKKKANYIEDMKSLLKESCRILSDDGLFLLYYNARDKESWRFMEMLETSGDLVIVGAFPIEYSANSVVQDNRKGGMKTDFVIVIKHKTSTILDLHGFGSLKGWVDKIPKIEE